MKTYFLKDKSEVSRHVYHFHRLGVFQTLKSSVDSLMCVWGMVMVDNTLPCVVYLKLNCTLAGGGISVNTGCSK